MWAAAEVIVNGQDVDVPLTLQPSVAINGRVAFEGSQPTPAELQTLSFMLVTPGSGVMTQGSGGGRGVTQTGSRGRVDAEGRFAFTDITPDAYQFVAQWTNPAASNKWTIKSSIANGRESLDAPLRVNPSEPVEWAVTFTDAPTHLTGVFQDRGGRAATDYFLLVFPTDRTYWTPGSRRVRMMRPATDGAFTAKGLPAGDYLLGALTDLEPGEWNDPAFLEQLVKSSVKVTLRDGETTSQDLRIGGAQAPTSATPRKTTMARPTRARSAASSRPIRWPSLSLGTVTILSTITRQGARRPFVSFGSIGRRITSASVTSVVKGHTVIESVASKRLSWRMSAGRGLPA